MPADKIERFKNKAVMITGGSSGIGLATAKAFVDEGASVAIVGRNQDELGKAVKKLGSSAFAICADISKTADIKRAFDEFKSKHVRLDVLFANAGVAKMAPVAETGEDMFDEIVATNFRGTFFTAKHAVPLLSDGGAVVFTTSFFDQVGLLGTSVVSATKAAVRSLTRTLAAELVERKIRVNAVAPGSIDTPAATKMGLSPKQIEEMVRDTLPQIPMGRVGEPEEIANVVTFLASDDASYITGFEINVDGGRLQI